MTQVDPKIAVAGYICLDILPELRDRVLRVEAGMTGALGPVRFACGGAVGNTGLALARLGLHPQLIAKIGDDPFGSVLRGLLAPFETISRQTFVVGNEDATAYSVVFSSPTHDRSLLSFPAANASLGADDVLSVLSEGTAILHFGYPNVMERMFADLGTEFETLVREASQKGIVTSVDVAGMADPSVDWRFVLGRAMPYVDLFMPSWDELRALLGARSTRRCDDLDLTSASSVSEIRDLAQQLLDMGAGAILLKLGKGGLYFKSTSSPARLSRILGIGLDGENWCGREIYQGCFEVEVVDTTGAGDAAIAGFLAALLERSSPEVACRSAAAVGALCVGGAGGGGCIPERDDAWSRIRSAWPVVDVSLPAGWSWSEREQVWLGPSDHQT